MGDAPSLGASLCLRPQCFSGSTFVTVWQDVISFHKPLYFYVPLRTICIQISCWPGDLLCSLAWAWGWDPQYHTISCTSVLARVSMGQIGHLRYQSDLSGWHGPSSHRIFQNACCSPASCVSVLSFPRACLGPASPTSVHCPNFHVAVSVSAHPC